MTQLIIDGLELPESKHGGYQASKTELSVDVVMISGRLTREVRGNVWELSYQYGWFDDAMRAQVLAVCEKGLREPVSVGFLPPDATGEELTYSAFLVTELRRPTFYWSRMEDEEGEEVPAYKGVWGDFSVTLREVAPSD